jgi:hypothetical protein
MMSPPLSETYAINENTGAVELLKRFGEVHAENGDVFIRISPQEGHYIDYDLSINDLRRRLTQCELQDINYEDSPVLVLLKVLTANAIATIDPNGTLSMNHPRWAIDDINGRALVQGQIWNELESIEYEDIVEDIGLILSRYNMTGTLVDSEMI